MEYLVRIFDDIEAKPIAEYELDELPYCPRIGEQLSEGNQQYTVLNVSSSFEPLQNNQYMIDYYVEEVKYNG